MRHGHVMPHRPAHAPKSPDEPTARAETHAKTAISILIALLAHQVATEAESKAVFHEDESADEN